MSATPYRAGLAALAANRPQQAVPLLREALAMGEGGPLAVLNLGMALTALGRGAEAEPHLHQAAAALPHLPEPLVRLGEIALARAEPAIAGQHFRAALARDPAHVPALAALAGTEETLGRLDAAADFLARARALEPEEPELALAAARLALTQGQAARAEALALAVLAARPAHALAARLLVAAQPRLAERLGKWATRDPLNPAWALANAFLAEAAGDLPAALPELEAACALAPEVPALRAELGSALALLDRPEDAAAQLRVALAANPADAALRTLLSTLLWKRHRYAEMVALLQAALAQRGPHPTLNMNLALALNAQGRQREALAAAEAGVAAAPGLAVALVNRMAVLPYHPERGTAAELRAAGEAIAAALPPPAPRRAVAPKARLRVGLLSGGLGVHPVGWLTLAGLEALPEAEFALFAYSLKPRRDALNARFRARCTGWREVGGLSDDGIAAAIRADGIDILLDMGGYGEGGRPFALRTRPAPVQVKWVGAQFATTGLPFIDHMLTDRWETPPGFEPFYTEDLLRLPDGYVCYAPPSYAPPVTPLPALANGHLTFGCFNNMAKITPAVLACWAELLRRLPTARLMLRTHALADAETAAIVHARLEAAGLPMDRLELLGGCPHPEMLASYGRIDLALDPFPYTGGLTVCEALYMGVPVVSLVGDSFAGRHALSHLSNVGLGDWAAADQDAYLARAQRAAADLPALATLRSGLRARVAASPLCDAARFGRHLASALRGAWAAAVSRDRDHPPNNL